MLGRASHNIMFANSCNKFSNKWQLIRDSIYIYSGHRGKMGYSGETGKRENRLLQSPKATKLSLAGKITWQESDSRLRLPCLPGNPWVGCKRAFFDHFDLIFHLQYLHCIKDVIFIFSCFWHMLLCCLVTYKVYVVTVACCSLLRHCSCFFKALVVGQNGVKGRGQNGVKPRFAPIVRALRHLIFRFLLSIIIIICYVCVISGLCSFKTVFTPEEEQELVKYIKKMRACCLVSVQWISGDWHLSLAK